MNKSAEGIIARFEHALTEYLDERSGVAEGRVYDESRTDLVALIEAADGLRRFIATNKGCECKHCTLSAAYDAARERCEGGGE